MPFSIVPPTFIESILGNYIFGTFKYVITKNDKQHHLFTPELLKQLHKILLDVAVFFKKRLQ